jgi:hypothetical protein
MLFLAGIRIVWELALVAATTAEFTQHAEDLGVPSAKALADAGRQYLAMDEWPKATPLRVRRARRWVDQAFGAHVLAALDSWVRDDFIYFADPAVHYLHAVERAQLDRETTPVTSVGLPSWVQTELEESPPRDRFRRIFATIDGNAVLAADVDGEAVETALTATAETRAFRSMWRELAARLTARQQEALRDWVLQVLGGSRTSLPLDVPQPDGRFRGHIS